MAPVPAFNLGKTKDMKKLDSRWKAPNLERSGILEYLEDVSKTDEHYIRIYECSDCWGFENIGVAIASHLLPMFAGVCRAVATGPAAVCLLSAAGECVSPGQRGVGGELFGVE